MLTHTGAFCYMHELAKYSSKVASSASGKQQFLLNREAIPWPEFCPLLVTCSNRSRRYTLYRARLGHIMCGWCSLPGVRWQKTFTRNGHRVLETAWNKRVSSVKPPWDPAVLQGADLSDLSKNLPVCEFNFIPALLSGINPLVIIFILTSPCELFLKTI